MAWVAIKGVLGLVIGTGGLIVLLNYSHAPLWAIALGAMLTGNMLISEARWNISKANPNTPDLEKRK